MFNVIIEDEDDNIVLATAHGGRADYIVSGDKHLLGLKQFKGIRIQSIDEMLKFLNEWYALLQLYWINASPIIMMNAVGEGKMNMTISLGGKERE